jgi:serine/threonine protein kinase
MPFPHTPVEATEDNNNNNPFITLVGGRYALIRCMAETALGKLYWACDQQEKVSSNDADCSHLLIFTLLPALAQNPVYEQALRQVLPVYRQKYPSEPLVADDGKESDGTRWLAIQDVHGMLLAERLHELDDRGIPTEEAVDILHGLAEAVGQHRPSGVFGFLEPGAVLVEENSYCLLNSPAVAALRLSSNGIIRSPDKRQTFHSGFISPEVALGEEPEESDDTFSIACIAYNLLQGFPPFGAQSTLESVVRNIAPPSLNKRKGNIWLGLQKGLSLKRSQRPATPANLINGLQVPKRPRLLMPAIAAGLASFVAYGSYHVLSGLGTPEETTIAANYSSNPATIPASEETGSTQATLVGEQSTPSPADAEIASLAADRAKAAEEAARIESIKREAEAQAAAELAAVEKTQGTAQQQEITRLLDDAEQAIQKHNLLSHDPGKPAAAELLAKVLKLDPENAEAKHLLTRMVNNLHDAAENEINQQHQHKANELLSTADNIITRFTLTDNLERQAHLEVLADQNNSGQTYTEQYIERANRAIDYGNLTEGDDRSNSAVAYISALFDAAPNNPQGITLLKKVVGLQHKQAETALRKNNADQARKLLDDSQKLIGEYTLDDQVDAQLDMEKRYRDVKLMGITASDNTTPPTRPTDRNGQQPPLRADKPSRPAATTTNNSPATNAAATTPSAPPVPAQPAPTAPVAETASTPAPTTDAGTNTSEPTSAADNSAADSQPATPFDQADQETSGQTAGTTNPPTEEVTVSPDIPVTEATPPVANIPPDAINLPPVQLDPVPAENPTPAQPETAAPVEAATDTTATQTDNQEQTPSGYAIPAKVGEASFTPDVEGLEEVPLEEIQKNLPPVDNGNVR